ncbi:hypothetical protein [Streptomyces mirabilis]|uniref:hypothetical protein n=1 Tax=Streptomyces mirabilis TaxID=68239 RepID=UPI0033C6FEA1
MKGALDRFAIDDGRHVPNIVIDDDASVAAGEACYVAHCSCGNATRPAIAKELALSAHMEHVSTRLGPSRGPDWMPLGVRLTLLMIACLALFMATQFGASLVIGNRTGAEANTIWAGAILLGFAEVCILTVAVRRFIAPTKL